MTPYLITPPAGPVVALPDLKAHLRIDHYEHDELIVACEQAAVAHMDGWTGVLGRCILPQTWAIALSAGYHVLPFPDVTGATVAGGAIEVQRSGLGPAVTLTEATIVEFTCAMPATLLPVAKVAIKMAVAEIYDRPEASAGSFGPAFVALVGALRWRV